MNKLKQSRLFESPGQINKILDRMNEAKEKGFVQDKPENNPYLLGSFCGVEPFVTKKWNVKIFRFSKSKKGYSVVCNDWEIFGAIKDRIWEYFNIPGLPVISIDDAGWGFPLCGVMVGASDGEKVVTDVVPVSLFQGHYFSSKEYMISYSDRGQILIEDEFEASPDTHRIEICTGYVNVLLKYALRNLGYDVRVVEIKGLLQDELEIRFKEYVKETIGQDIYYDPKEMDKNDIPLEYHKCVDFGRKHFPHLLKSGWKSMQEVAS